MERKTLAPTEFMTMLIVVAAGLIVIDRLISLGFRAPFGTVLLISGTLSMITGSLLGLPGRRYRRSHHLGHINTFKFPAPEEYLAGKLFIASDSTPFYSFENAVLFAGLVLLLTGMLVLF